MYLWIYGCLFDLIFAICVYFDWLFVISCFVWWLWLFVFIVVYLLWWRLLGFWCLLLIDLFAFGLLVCVSFVYWFNWLLRSVCYFVRSYCGRWVVILPFNCNSVAVICISDLYDFGYLFYCYLVSWLFGLLVVLSVYFILRYIDVLLCYVVVGVWLAVFILLV